MKKLLHILFIYIGITISIAQQYPVRLIPSIFQPYSLKLGDYATSTEPKLQLQLLMTDLMEPQHQTGLKFSLESGLNAVPLAVSNDFVVGFSPFTLYPGSQLTLSNIDVRALFELQNLSGINSVQYAQALPDGVYQFCFQAYDYYTKNNLSQKSCATVYLVQYDPPQLNLPQNGEKLQAITPYSGGSGIVFQWMPRQIAPNTKYIFTLKELWDLGQSPISGFLSSRVLWQEESYAPTLFYGLDKPQLMPGKRYAWQVQAKSGNPVLGANPTEDNGVYKNNGLTEIFYFDYVEDCTLPTLLMAKNAGRGRIELSWNLSGKPSGLYQVQYRRKGSNTQWQTVQSYQPRYIITGLEDQTEYEYRVGNACGQLATAGNNDNPITDSHSAGNAYAYSGIQYFTTDSKDKTNQNYQCGVMPAVDITNKTPLQSLLGANEVFMAGDFPVTVLEAQGSNGIYSGTGYIVVPYLADTKVKVSFNNIKLNTDRKLIEGVIETTYDPTEKNIVNVGDILNDLGNLIDGIVKIIDDAIGNDGMSQSDYDKLFDDVNNLIGKNNQDTSSLYDQGLITPKLKKEIEDLEQKIKDELKDLTCAVKDDKKKGSDEVAETDCIQKLKNLKADIEELKSKNAEKDEMRCIWNIAPNENLKGKTYYFQISEKNNDGEGKKLYKLKEGDYPISFNKNEAVYTFKSKGKIYRPFSDNSYYFSNTSEDKYVFETGDAKSLVDIKIDDNNANAVTINGVQITAQQDCTDAKERGKGLSENLVFSTVVKGKYSISIEQDGKGKFISTFKLLGKGNSKISDSQKTGIEQEVQNSINAVLKDLKDPKDLNSLSNKTEVTDFGFYVKQMTGKEWIETLSDLGTTVWEEASLPKNYWNEDEAGYTNSTIRMPALFTGVADGVIGEVTSYPQLIKLGYDVATKEEVRTGLWNSVKNISPSSVYTLAEGAIKDKIAKYNFSDKPYLGYYEVSKDGVQIISMAMGAGFFKQGKNALKEGTKDVADKIKKEVKKDIEKAFVKNIDGVINNLKKRAKYILEGTGEYRRVGGHHPLAKKAFEGVENYDYKKAFSIKPSSLEDAWKTVNAGIPQNIHAKVTGNQNALYSAWRKANPLKQMEIGEMADIEIKAMVNAGIPEDIATGWVVKALEDLQAKGVKSIANIPWNGVN